MGYSVCDSIVRVDSFKSASGKWYSTYAVDMKEFWLEPFVERALKKAIMRMYVDSGGKPDPNFIYVCIEPYHKNQFPLCVSFTKEECI